MEMWQIAQVKKALDAFCEKHDVELNDDTAVRATDHLLKMARNGVDDADLLVAGLRDHIADCSEDAPEFDRPGVNDASTTRSAPVFGSVWTQTA